MSKSLFKRLLSDLKRCMPFLMMKSYQVLEGLETTTIFNKMKITNQVVTMPKSLWMLKIAAWLAKKKKKEKEKKYASC